MDEGDDMIWNKAGAIIKEKKYGDWSDAAFKINGSGGIS